MFADFLLDRFNGYRAGEAIIWRGKSYSYSWIADQVSFWKKTISDSSISKGTVAGLQGDFSPNGVALMLALIDIGCIIVPLTLSVLAKRGEFFEVAEVEKLIEIDGSDQFKVASLTRNASHELYQGLRKLGHPGLILFSSGSTGKSKAALHDLVPFLAKFETQRKAIRTISFLLYDHIGGINTMFHTLSNGGCLITVDERNPDSVLAAVAKHRVELLPTSPTFLNLVLISEAYKRHDLSALKLITYGTEPMPESTLKRLHAILPEVQLSQTYGLSEVGILRAKSRSSDSLWVKVGGEGFETRIVDGLLEIKARSAMLGYLNAPSPFTQDGWFRTGDRVEVDGEYLRILGRDSELINVGGQKVYPAEVESVILEMDEVTGVEVFGMRNPITGNIVCANVSVNSNQDNFDPREFIVRLKASCQKSLEGFKVPVKVVVVDGLDHSPRFKKVRTKSSANQVPLNALLPRRQQRKSRTMKIRIAKPADAADLAHVYHQCFSELPDAFLPKLGVGFLTEYHRVLLSEAHSLALCAENDEGKVVGFTCGTLDAAEHMEALKKNKLRLLLVSLPTLMRKPSLVKQMILRMKALSATSASMGTDQATAFVVSSGCRLESWGWLQTDRSGGQALQLLRKWLDMSKSLGAGEVWLEVDCKMVGKVHRMMGAKTVTEIVLPDGRKRQVMRYDFSGTS